MATFCLSTNTGPKLLIFRSEIFLSHKKSLLFKFFDAVVLDVILRIALPLPIKNPGCVFARIQETFMSGSFPFNQSKNNAVLEPRTGHFQGLVGFEVKTKELCGQDQSQGIQNASSRTPPLMMTIQLIKQKKRKLQK